MNHRKAFLTGAATPIAAAVVLAARWPRFVAWIERRERQRALAYARTHRPPPTFGRVRA